MKEYIAKDELLKRKRDINLANVPFNFIDICPKVTEADICREFAERIKEMFDFCEKNAMGIIDVDIAKGLVDKTLADMEKENA